MSAYATAQGVRWRIAVPLPDGRVSTRRGYRTREAACRACERIAGSPAVGADASFARFWRAWLAEKRPYITDGSLEDLETHGRKRLLPHLAQHRISEITAEHIRVWMTAMTEQQQAGEISAKTINNARVALSSAVGDAAGRGLLSHNPCQSVPPLPLEHHELDYVRLAEIDPYLRSCPAHYRPLADLLIGTGARISEALALTRPDIDLDRGTVQIQRQRPRRGETSREPNGKRGRSVLIPRLTDMLRTLRASARPASNRPDWLFLCPPPSRGRYATRPAGSPPGRRTVNEWHDDALTAAGLRSMPLHALRHTSAASWLTTGHSLLFLSAELKPHVPVEINDLFRVAQGAMLYGWFFYPLFRLGEEQLYRVCEAAAAARYVQLGGDEGRPTFNAVISQLVDQGAIHPDDVARWDAMRLLRNAASHPRQQSVMTPGHVQRVLEAAAHDINRLFTRGRPFAPSSP